MTRNLIRKSSLFLTFIVLVVLQSAAACQETNRQISSESISTTRDSTPANTPNIVLIFIDDMGYGDIGPFGNKTNKTPCLDRMAKEGNVLTQFYVANTACTPSRAALMTGTYAARIGMDGRVCFPGEERGLNPSEITIAEMLKEKGYVTGCFGKWHLGDQPEFLPLQQGFDRYFGIPYSNDMWPGNKRGNPLTNRGPYTPLPVLSQNEVVSFVSDGEDQSLLCEVITDHAVKFIEDNKDKPFFCYVPHAYVHKPRFARPDILKKAEGNVDRANVEEVDTSVGRILDKLRELKLDKNTLVVFTSDNGGAGGMSMGPLRGAKGGPKYEGHMREPTITWWPGKIPAGVRSDGIGVTTDLLPSFAKLASAEVPNDRKIDGKDVLDILLGKPNAKSPHTLHYYETDGIRRGRWKLVKKPKSVELFNLDDDLGERKNLAKQKPQIVNELKALLQQHAEALKKETRKAGFIDKAKAKPLISKPGELPKLRDYMQSKADAAFIPQAEPVAINLKADWKYLFNGKNLEGWQANTLPESFSVKDGVLKVHGKNGMSHLFYVGANGKDVAFKNFELVAVARSEPNSNSGIFFHTDRELRNGKYLNKGYEVQLNSSKKEKRKTGSLYGIVDLPKSSVDETDWFVTRIRVEGIRIQVSINGKKVVDYTEPKNPKRSAARAKRLIDPNGGAIALQAHDPKSVFYFKEIRIKELK